MPASSSRACSRQASDAFARRLRRPASDLVLLEILVRGRDRLEPRQVEEAAGSLDGVNDPENFAQKIRIVRALLELDQIDIEYSDVFCGFSEEFAQ